MSSMSQYAIMVVQTAPGELANILYWNVRCHLAVDVLAHVQVMGYLSWREGMDVIIRHQVQKALPSFVLDILPKQAADGVSPAKRKAQAAPDDQGRSAACARTTADHASAAATATAHHISAYSGSQETHCGVIRAVA